MVVWSDSTATSSAAGSDCSSFGSSAFSAATTAITFDPGCRWMLRMIAGVRPAQAASSAFSVPCTTVATFCRRTASPFL